MSRDKQIEEMMKAQCVFYGQCDNCPCHPSDFDPYGVCRISCKRLYNAGYRKASDVAREIFEEIEKNIFGLVTPYQTLHCIHDGLIAELKKKYESEGEG